MKLLVAYDGSRCAEIAIDDLSRAGLPDECDCCVVSVEEGSLPGAPSASNGEDLAGSDALVAEARALAAHAKKRLERMFPRWTVKYHAGAGSPGGTILNTAQTWSPDLIVAGCQGRTAVGRFVLGTISQQLLTEAQCSVRIARGRREVNGLPTRVLIGMDGLSASTAAMEAVLARRWRPRSELRLICIIDENWPEGIGRFTDPSVAKRQPLPEPPDWVHEMARRAQERLMGSGTSVSLRVHPGSPKVEILKEAGRWSADCIYVGASSGASSGVRFRLGSTASAIASRAHCSVEVIRSVGPDQC